MRRGQKQTVTKTTTTTTKTSSRRQPKLQLKDDEVEKIQEAFQLFDYNGTGKIDPSFVRETMDKMNYEEKNPVVYKIIVQLDTPENEKNGGVNYKEFLEQFDDELGDKNSKEGIQRIYNEYTVDSDSGTITPEVLRKICDEQGDDLTDEEIQIIMDTVGNGNELTFDDFYTVMTKTAYS